MHWGWKIMFWDWSFFKATQEKFWGRVLTPECSGVSWCPCLNSPVYFFGLFSCLSVLTDFDEPLWVLGLIFSWLWGLLCLCLHFLGLPSGILWLKVCHQFVAVAFHISSFFSKQQEQLENKSTKTYVTSVYMIIRSLYWNAMVSWFHIALKITTYQSI